ncbi:hypothetical protein [Streptomyces sp. NPDC047982]|uniref:hypothetical protein n=1 Tax=Streptomyces sp. NPDC047982 TaxID=3365495 RepID=UPI0037108452
MTNATSTTAERGHPAGRWEWTAFVVLLLPLLLVSMDISVRRAPGVTRRASGARRQASGIRHRPHRLGT